MGFSKNLRRALRSPWSASAGSQLPSCLEQLDKAGRRGMDPQRLERIAEVFEGARYVWFAFPFGGDCDGGGCIGLLVVVPDVSEEQFTE